MMRQRPLVNSQEAVDLLAANIHELQHPEGVIKHPYFDERFTANREGVRKMKTKFCEAIVALLEQDYEIKKRRR